MPMTSKHLCSTSANWFGSAWGTGDGTTKYGSAGAGATEWVERKQSCSAEERAGVLRGGGCGGLWLTLQLYDLVQQFEVSLDRPKQGNKTIHFQRIDTTKKQQPRNTMFTLLEVASVLSFISSSS